MGLGILDGGLGAGDSVLRLFFCISTGYGIVDATLDGVPYLIVLGIGDSCVGVSGNGISVGLCGVDVCGCILCGDRDRVNGEVSARIMELCIPIGVSISVAGLSPLECLDRDLLKLLGNVDRCDYRFHVSIFYIHMYLRSPELHRIYPYC